MKVKNCLAAAVTLFPLLVPGASQAQAMSDQWRVDATVYGWFPTISGTTAFPASSGGTTINITAEDILDSLKFTFMGTLEVRKGVWGVWTDVIYLDVGASKSATRDATVGAQVLPAGVTLNADLDQKSWIWTIAGTYTVIDSPTYRMEVLAGARLLDFETKLNWAFSGNIASLPLPGRSGTSTVTQTNWDGVVGVKGRAVFGDDRKWFVPYYLDLGTGQSSFTWQGIVGVGYDFGWGSAIAAWRYLDYDFKSSSKIDDANFSGPAIGLAFRW